MIRFRALVESQTTVRNRYRDRYRDRGGDKEELDEDAIPDEIKNATLDNIFDEDDIIDLSAGYEQINEYYEDIQDPMEKNDALVIIGRKSRVELCIFMIEMTLNHFRTITKTRNNVRSLRNKINELKGNQGPPYGYGNNYGRGRGRGQRGRGGRGR